MVTQQIVSNEQEQEEEQEEQAIDQRDNYN
jgi:hypothetical protein